MRFFIVIVLMLYAKLSVAQLFIAKECRCAIDPCDKQFTQYIKQGTIFLEKGNFKRAKKSFLYAGAISKKDCIKSFLKKTELIEQEQFRYKNKIKPTVSDIVLRQKEHVISFILPSLKEIVSKTDTFFLAENEVTQREWALFCKEKNIDFAISNPEYPIVNVSWNEADAYCDWLSNKTGQFFRLPTEDEWVFALGKIPTLRLEEFSWAYDPNKNDQVLIHAVKSKKPNAFGLYDMLGNVSEWTMDWYNDRLSSEAITNDEDIGDYKLVLGCSYEDELFLCKEVVKKSFEPTFTKENIGFRICTNKN
jgi:formylglycine-generating enzyme